MWRARSSFDVGSCSAGGVNGNKLICPKLQKYLNRVGALCLFRYILEKPRNMHECFHFSITSLFFSVDLVCDFEPFPASSGLRLCSRRNAQKSDQQQNHTYFHGAGLFFFFLFEIFCKA